jgi:hypothetical protein
MAGDRESQSWVWVKEAGWLAGWLQLPVDDALRLFLLHLCPFTTTNYPCSACVCHNVCVCQATTKGTPKQIGEITQNVQNVN